MKSMATGTCPSAIFGSVNNPYSFMNSYKPSKMACGQQLNSAVFEQANKVNNIQYDQASREPAEGKVIAPQKVRPDLHSKLDLLYSDAAQLVDKREFDRRSLTESQGCTVNPQHPERNLCVSQDISAQLNNLFSNLLNPAMSGDYGSVSISQIHQNSVPEMVSAALPQHQLQDVTPLDHEQLLKQQHKVLLAFALQQNQTLIELIKQRQERASCSPQTSQPQDQFAGSQLPSRSLSGCSEPSNRSSPCDAAASHKACLAQIYADASRQTAMTDGLPFAQWSSEQASLSKTSATSRDREAKLRQMFKRIDDMHAAMQRSDEEKARWRPRRSRYVRKSPPRLKLVPSAHEEFIVQKKGGQSKNDCRFLTTPVSCTPDENTRLTEKGMSLVESPSVSTNMGYFNADGSLILGACSPSLLPYQQAVALLVPADQPAHELENVMLINSNNIDPQGCSINYLAHNSLPAQVPCASNYGVDHALDSSEIAVTFVNCGSKRGHVEDGGSTPTKNNDFCHNDLESSISAVTAMNDVSTANVPVDEIYLAPSEYECFESVDINELIDDLLSGETTAAKQDHSSHNDLETSVSAVTAMNDASTAIVPVDEIYLAPSEYECFESVDINELIDDLLSGETTATKQDHSLHNVLETSFIAVTTMNNASTANVPVDEIYLAPSDDECFESVDIDKLFDDLLSGDSTVAKKDRSSDVPRSEAAEGINLDWIDFNVEPVLNMEPSLDGNLAGKVSSLDGGLPTFAYELHGPAQPNSMAASFGVLHDLEDCIDVAAPQVTCGTEQVDVNKVLLTEPFENGPLTFPDKNEPSDSATGAQLKVEPEGVSVFASLERSREEDRNQLLFTRRVDAQTSMARELELGYPDLTEVVERIGELTEAVGGYWPVSDKAAWMLDFLHPNELLYLKSLMIPEWKFKIDAAATAEDISVCTYYGLCELLLRFGGSNETKYASDSSREQSDTRCSRFDLHEGNASVAKSERLQKRSSLKRKRDDHEHEKGLSPKRRSTRDDVELFQ